MIKHITETEQRLTNTLRTTTEALTLVTAERDAFKSDAERLDFLISQRAYVVSDESCCDGFWLHYVADDGSISVQIASSPTPREAIDAAMKGTS